MKKYLGVLFIAFVLCYAPWRLMALGVEVLCMHPGPTRVTQDDSSYWQALSLELRLTDLGWVVTYQAGMVDHDLYGMTSPSEHTVKVEQSLHWNARYQILAHEGGHTLEPGWLNRGQGEVFAEVVAMLVTHDGLREHARYLSRDKMGFLFTSLMEWQAMYNAAEMLGSY